MAKITVLDINTVNQIAAGEVIERPASIVKELLENAIDAQATAVTVEIKDGGTSLVRITDNGCGIPKDEIRTAFLPHATSKIRTAEDLITVSSLGFRGEALASIASVAQVEVITKTAKNLTGTRYQIEGGLEKSIEEVGAPEGTTFLVRNLFYNTPARRKFLKSPASEATYIGELVERIALSHPGVSIRFISNNQNKLHTTGNHNIKDIIYTVYGREIASNLIQVKGEGDILSISGFIGKPVVARGNRNYENYFINGRYVKSSLIAKAIEDAFGPYMMVHKYPFTVLYLQIDPELMDVNVHPTKMELRFRESEKIYQAVFTAVKEALNQKELIPEMSLADKRERKMDQILREASAPEPFEKRRIEKMNPQKPPSVIKETGKYEVNSLEHTLKSQNVSEQPALGSLVAKFEEMEPVQKQVRPSKLQQSWEETRRDLSEEKKPAEQIFPSASSFTEPGTDIILKKEERAEQLDLFEEKLLSKEARNEHKLIGQLFDTYWLVQFKEQLFIIDQHAAHEKVLYEKTMRAMADKEYTSQRISPPIILTLSMKEELLMKQCMEYFTEIGFEIEHFGGREYSVSAVPDNLFQIAKKELLMELIDGLSEDLGSKGSMLIQEKIASMSCKAAVKGNNRISPQEADHLIDQLLELENPYSCPHGRPTIVAMSKYELEKKFKRIV